jgi:DNA-binding response OmpR family regulator
VDPILVVDDDPSIREALQVALTGEGWPVVCVGDGWEAVDWMLAQRPSVVLLDWSLPDFNGDFIAETLHNTYQAEVPIILVTGQTDLGKREEWVRAFASLRKPFELDELCSLVTRALSSPAAA